MSRDVVIGIGNAMRGDDAAGVAVVDRLRARVAPDVDVVACSAEPSRLMEAWAGATSVTLVDAVSSGAPPGTLRRFDATDTAVPARAFGGSTHAIGVAETIELARALGKLPHRVCVYGIEGGDYAPGAALTPRVDAAVDAVVHAILSDLEEEPCTSER